MSATFTAQDLVDAHETVAVDGHPIRFPITGGRVGEHGYVAYEDRNIGFSWGKVRRIPMEDAEDIVVDDVDPTDPTVAEILAEKAAAAAKVAMSAPAQPVAQPAPTPAALDL